MAAVAKNVLLYLCLVLVKTTQSRRTHYIHWNKSNPMFRLDNTDHIVDVNAGNHPWEYDQVNIICPMSKPDPNSPPERHVIYSVSREEFDSCRITNPKPKIVAVCSKPYQLLYFTITFRSFTPTPGGLEFHPGQDYYFISTSSKVDLHRRVGGGCATHNMKMIFRVADGGKQKSAPSTTTTTTTTTTTERPLYRFNSKIPYAKNEFVYYYHPRDLVHDNYKHSQGSNDFMASNEVWGTNALRYTSSGQKIGHSAFLSAVLCIIMTMRL